MVKEIFNPDLYHGKNKNKNYFEGWYFKIVDQSKQNVFAFIPGICFSGTKTNSHSFIQLLRGNEALFNYFKYDLTEFSWNNKNFNIMVAENSFSLNKMVINLKEESLNIVGEISFKNFKKWPATFLNPGSMGYYNFIPFMECYSQVCAMDVDLTGSLRINDKIIDFNNGNGYMEKNWGSSFPLSWIWIQCNCFKNYKAALSCSIGHIPFLQTSFRGFLIGVLINDKFYKFTTMNKSKVFIKEINGDIELTAENPKYRLLVKTSTDKSKFIKCFGPKNNEMIPLLEENLKGNIEVQLIDSISNNVIFNDSGECTGIEYGGDQKKILNNIH